MESLLFTDRYCLSMSQRRWRAKENDLVSFEMFIRRMPTDRGYMMVAGLGTLLWWLERIGIDRKAWEWLIDNGFDPDFATWLFQKSHVDPHFFTGDVWAVPEGTTVGAETPILRVTAPRVEATLIESLVLSTINHQTMVASKASRIVDAAQGGGLWDFSMRRGHGVEASVGVARAAYIAGFSGTATCFPGMRLGIPTTGTMAHHEIMSEGPEGEQDIFEATMREFPDSHALLVDTYDTQEGVRNAIRAAEFLTDIIPLRAIRIDSGDLGAHAKWARGELDKAGFTSTKILASSDLDEYSIDALVKQRAPIDGFGVGTMLATVPDAPNVGGVYKLVQQHEREPHLVMKLAENKANDPGCHQVWRQEGRVLGNDYAGDIIAMDTEEAPKGYRPLLHKVMENGRAFPQPSLVVLHGAAHWSRLALPPDFRQLRPTRTLPVRRSHPLQLLRYSLGDRSIIQELT